MRNFIVALLLLLSGMAFGQTTVTSGEWTDGTVWTGGAVPAAGGTVTVSHAQDILSNLAPTGVWTFSANATDLPGGAAYNFNPAAGGNTITISSGAVVTFTGNASDFASGTIDIYGTLILGNLELSNSLFLNVTVHAGGTLIVNGTLTNNNFLRSLEVNGTLQVNGDYNGTFATAISGSGTINTTGTIDTGWAGNVFGSTNNCTTGPCSGEALTCTFANSIAPGTATLCSGSSITLTANSTGTTPTYQWESSTDNTSWANASGTSTNATYNAASLTATRWYRVRKTVSGCTSTSAAVKITILSGGGWKGTTANWATASNWCSGAVPTNTTDVIIANAPGIPNLPLIGAGTGAVCNNLTIANTYPVTSLTIDASATASLSISGSFINNGTFTDNSTAAAAGLKFPGSGAQTISGSSAIVVNNLTVAKTGGGSITASTANISVNNNLTFTSGTVNMSGFTLKLGISAASTGTLAFTAGQIQGGNFQRWYPTTAVAQGNASMFPLGATVTTTAYYRRMYLVSAGLSASGGTIKVSHTRVADAGVVSFADGGTVARRSNSFWTVTTNGLSSTGTPFSIRTDAEGMGTVGLVSHLRLTLAAAAAPGSNGTQAGTVTIPQVNRTGLSVANLSNTFYWGSTNAGATTLPVVLRWFDGAFRDNQVELSWKTESERNCDYFSVLHSANGEEFTEIGQVKGLGTSSTGKLYSMIHDRPARGINYYQLRQFDFDGTKESFQVIRVEADLVAQFLSVYPNPVHASGILTIDLQVPTPSSSVDISIFDIAGKSVFQFTGQPDSDGEATIDFDTSALTPGMYIVRAGTATELVFVR